MRKKWFLSLSVALIAALAFAQIKDLNSMLDNEFLKSLREKLLAFVRELPQDRVYLHTDKPFYKSGETIWFAAYLRNGETLKASTQSQILYVELINPKGAVEKTLSLIAPNGSAQGDFVIDPELPGGLYKLRAYTNWMKNEPNEFNREFVKEIQVQKVVLPRLLMKLDFDRKGYTANEVVTAKLSLRTLDNTPLAHHKFVYKSFLLGEEYKSETGTTDNQGNASISFSLPPDLDTNDGLLNVLIEYKGQTESISRAIPIQLDNIALGFFPEGGDAVVGQPTRIAFMANNDLGKPTDIEGEIRDEKDKVVAKFTSYHNGMGAFDFTYQPGATYRAVVKQRNYPLPEPQPKGYTLNVKSLDKEKLGLTVHSSFAEELALVVSLRSKVYFTTTVTANIGSNSLEVPLQDLPAGVAVVTLFDSKGIERAERLVFVNAHRKLNLTLTTDKDKYQPREKVELTLSATDERGMGIPGQFSLSVVDDKLFTFADDKQGNILSQLLLEQDLTEKIEEAAFYFDPKEEKAPTALNYLLMTKGWRRFTWKEILEGKKPTISHPSQKAVIAGTVFGDDTKPLAGVSVKLPDGRTQITQKDGRFSFEGVLLYETLLITAAKEPHLMTQEVSRYREDIEIYLYPRVYATAVAKGVFRRNRALNNAPGERKLGFVADDEDAFEDGAAMGIEEALPMAEAPPAPMQAVEAAPVMELQKDDFNQGKRILADRKEAPDFQNEDPAAVAYYRARVFPKPVYPQGQRIETRTDFRSTIFWEGALETDRSGKAKVIFYNSDEITTFRAICEGVGAEGSVGRAEMTYATSLPFSMDCKLPTQVTMGDEVIVNLVFNNNTPKPFEGTLEIKAPQAWKPSEKINPQVKIAASGTSNRLLRFQIQNTPGKDSIYIALLDGNGSRDAFVQEVEVGYKGFPVALSASSQALEFKTNFNINQPVEGTLQAGFVAYPSVVDDLMAGIESILREPYGCFEQTSSSTYPNIVVLNYLNTIEHRDEATKKRALDLIDKGYKRLVGYETKEKGYEWFGGTPAHEALTAYGLMEFKDMQGVYAGVDNTMVERTANYLIGRKDGKGGFLRNPQALDAFGGASPQITNAYIVYAMAEAGYGELVAKEFEACWLEKSKDPYIVALLANAIFSVPTKITTARQLLDELHALRNPDGSWTGSTHSITRSGGQALTIETTALAALALNKMLAQQAIQKDIEAFRKAIEFLVGGRNAFGGYGNTQATILALKALAAYATYSKQTAEAGDIEIWVEGKKVAQTHYDKGHKGEIQLDGLEKHFKEGKNEVKVYFRNCKKALPYTLRATYSTLLPVSSKECNLQLKTVLAANKTRVGETLRLNATLTNTTKEGQPMTIAVIGIPGGLAPQPWQLKKMQEEKVFDFYEIIGNRLAIYYRQMKPAEVRSFALDLKAEMAGRYEAPASCAYLYYTAEHKNWQPALSVEVK